MSRWTREGSEIYYLICTDGDKGGTRNPHNPGELVEIRRSEQMEAAKVVGVKEVLFLGRKDGELVPDAALRRDIVRVIRQVKPRKMFTFDPANLKFNGFYLYHSDHRAAGLAVFDAIYPAAKNRLYFPELLVEGLEPHRVEELYFYGTYEPNVWIDISGVIDLKIEALRRHQSQLNGKRAEQVEEFILQRARNAAKGRDFEYAEAFRMITWPF